MSIEKCRHGQIRGHCDFCRHERHTTKDRDGWQPPITSRVSRIEPQKSLNFQPTLGNRRCPECNGKKVIIRGADGKRIRCSVCFGVGEIKEEPRCYICLNEFGSWGDVVDHLKTHKGTESAPRQATEEAITTDLVPEYPAGKFEAVGMLSMLQSVLTLKPLSHQRSKLQKSSTYKKPPTGNRPTNHRNTRKDWSVLQSSKRRVVRYLARMKRRLPKPHGLLRSRISLIFAGLAITLGSIGYYQFLLDWWPFGLIKAVRWAEPFTQVFGVGLVLIGIFINRHYKRMRFVQRALLILLLIATGTYVYNYLDDTGKLNSWLDRITQENTAPDLVMRQTPSLAETLQSLDSYLRLDGSPIPAITSSGPTTLTLSQPKDTATKTIPTLTLLPPQSNTSKVSIGRSYIVGAKGNPIRLVNNPKAENPTWGQLAAFLKKDTTDKKPYRLSSFVCADFAEMLHNNAEAAGWKAAYVVVKLGPSPGYPSGAGHTLNAFETIDRGLVYIDSTGTLSGDGPLHGETTISLAVGNSYIPKSIFSEPGWNDVWGNMGKILAIEKVQW